MLLCFDCGFYKLLAELFSILIIKELPPPFNGISLVKSHILKKLTIFALSNHIEQTID